MTDLMQRRRESILLGRIAGDRQERSSLRCIPQLSRAWRPPFAFMGDRQANRIAPMRFNFRGMQTRALPLDHATVTRDAADDRRVTLAFSSEEPVERWWGVEILDHRREAVRLGRIRNGAALLLNHDTGRHVGVVESVALGSDRVARAQVRFSRSPEAQRVLDDVRDGIRTKVSVGYRIHDLESAGERQGELQVYRVTDWEPFEVSIVSVPADDTVGVGRSADFSTAADDRAARSTTSRGVPMDREVDMHDEGNDPRNLLSRRERRAQRNGELDQTELEQRAERARVQDIRDIGAMWKDYGGPELARAAALDPGVSVANFRALILARVTERQEAVAPTETGRLAADEQHPGFQKPGYGEGARETFTHRPLRCFTGRDGQRAAHAFGMFLLAQLPGNVREQRWLADHYGSRALSNLGNSAGTLVPEEVSSMLIRNLDSFGVSRREAQLWPMNSDSLVVPTNTSRPTASFNAAGSEVAASDPGFQGVTLSAKQLMAQTVIARETMSDAVIPLGDFVGQSIVEAFAEKEDDCLFNGDGTSTYGGMQGLLSVLAAGSQVTATGHDILSELDATDFSNVIGALPEFGQPGAKWFCSRAVFGAAMQRLMIAAGGNDYRSIEAGPSSNLSFAGFPVVLSPKAPSGVATDFTGTEILYFGDMRRTVAFGDRQVISLLVDPYTHAGKAQIRIVGYERFECVVHGVGTASAAGPMIAMIGGT